MLIDARSLAPHAQIQSDICIVGGGVAGMILAKELANQPFRICILESGGLELDEKTQSLAAGESVGYKYFPLETAYGRCFGGSSNRWHIDIGGDTGVRFRPLDPIDFEKRDWVPYSGWPFDKTHLDPYYDRAQAISKLLPSTYAVEDWSAPDKAALPIQGDCVETIIYKFPRRDTFSRELRETVTKAGNVTVYTNANATEIETDSTGEHAVAVTVRCLDGSRSSVRAKIIILATNGLEAPRLLLLSNKRQTSGLGNQHDLVGRFFMEHLHFWSGVFVPSRPEIFEQAGLYYAIHKVNGIAVIGKLALGEKVLRERQLLNQNVQLFPERRLKPGGYPPVCSTGIDSFRALLGSRHYRTEQSRGQHVANIVRDAGNVLRMARRRIGKIVDALRKGTDAFILANMVEQIPNPNSRVTLGGSCDTFGLPRVRLDWKVNAVELGSVIRTQEILDEEFRKAGLGRVIRQLKDATPPPDLEGGYHQMGTTRMHINPREGVVDENCRVHGLKNLFVSGPSVFPTGGYANPTLTVVALAIRLADHLKEQMSRAPALEGALATGAE
jgi:choline dehydrogenase-like flavoprotein